VPCDALDNTETDRDGKQGGDRTERRVAAPRAAVYRGNVKVVASVGEPFAGPVTPASEKQATDRRDQKQHAADDQEPRHQS
jgi:hypothetical protein